MQNRFLRVGDQVFAVDHILHAIAFPDGDVDVYLSNQPESVRLYTSTGEGPAFWAWLTSAMNCTTLQIPQTLQDTREKISRS